MCLRDSPFRVAKQQALIGLFKPPLEVVVRDLRPVIGGVIGRRHDPETGTGFWSFE